MYASRPKQLREKTKSVHYQFGKFKKNHENRTFTVYKDKSFALPTLANFKTRGVDHNYLKLKPYI